MTDTLPRPLVHLTDNALADARRAISFYNQRVSGLGRAFLHELAEQLRRIRRFPHGYPRIDSSRRRATLQRFPFAVVYQVTDDHIQIIGVFDCRADPAKAQASD